jgi:hypothetical protein
VNTCSAQPSCVGGVSCTIGVCTTGGGIDCIAKCFNNNILQLTVALSAVQCVYGTCGTSCVGGVAAPPFMLDETQLSETQLGETQ